MAWHNSASKPFPHCGHMRKHQRLYGRLRWTEKTPPGRSPQSLQAETNTWAGLYPIGNNATVDWLGRPRLGQTGEQRRPLMVSCWHLSLPAGTSHTPLELGLMRNQASQGSNLHEVLHYKGIVLFATPVTRKAERKIRSNKGSHLEGQRSPCGVRGVIPGKETRRPRSTGKGGGASYLVHTREYRREIRWESGLEKIYEFLKSRTLLRSKGDKCNLSYLNPFSKSLAEE